jgi:hypothetical protein
MDCRTIELSDYSYGPHFCYGFPIDHLPIPDLILKLYTFSILLFELIPLQGTNWFPFNARATERIKNLSIIFLKFIDN